MYKYGITLAISAALAVLFWRTVPELPRVFGQATTTTSTVNITVEIPGVPPPPPPVGGGGAYIPDYGPASVILKGFASPDSILTVVRNGATAATDKVSASGEFSKTLRVTSGIANLGLWVRDSLGLLSSTANLSINLLPNATTTVSNLYLSPTIGSEVHSGVAGRSIVLFGTSHPLGIISVFGNSIFLGTTTPDVSGRWEFPYALAEDAKGPIDMFAKANLLTLGLFSPESPLLTVLLPELLACPNGADLNGDGRVNVADLSILLFYWRESNPKNACADLTGDFQVNVADLSIMMYEWTR